MNKRIIVVHGWDGYPEEGWFPWLKGLLESRGFTVIIPAMPSPAYPKIEEWVPYLSHIIGTPDEQTYLIGHSIGCQTIMRFLQTKNQKVGGVIFVAGWFNLLPESIADEESQAIARPWIETPINYERVMRAANVIVAIFSDDDPAVPLSDAELFRERLGATIIVERGKGHFSGSDNITTLPVVAEQLFALAAA